MYTSSGGDSPGLHEVDWTPERKVVGAAAAVVATGLLSYFTGFDPFAGFEGAVGILVAYFLPNKK